MARAALPQPAHRDGRVRRRIDDHAAGRPSCSLERQARGRGAADDVAQDARGGHRAPARAPAARSARFSRIYLNARARTGTRSRAPSAPAEAYFGVGRRMLTVAQAAFLAGLPQRPSRFNPYRDARRRRAPASGRCCAAWPRRHALTAVRAASRRGANGWRSNAGPRPSPRRISSRWCSTTGERRGPREFETTLDRRAAARRRRHHRQLSARRCARHGAHNVAVVVLDNARGEWLAWEGSGDYFDGEHGGSDQRPLRAAAARLGAEAVHVCAGVRGRATRRRRVLPDVPSHFPTAEPGIVYTPAQLRRPVPRAAARAPRARRIGERAGGRARVANSACRCCCGSSRGRLHDASTGRASYYGLGVTLGNAEVRLDELVAAYAALRARRRSGSAPTCLARATPAAYAERAARLAADRLLDDRHARLTRTRGSYIFGRGGSLELPFPVAVKTGTSQAYHDNWTIGYHARRHGRRLGRQFRSDAAHAGRPASPEPGRSSRRHARGRATCARARGVGRVDRRAAVGAGRAGHLRALPGMRAGAACPRRVKKWLPANASPLPCSWHHASEEGLLTLWPDSCPEWAASQRLLPEEGSLRADATSAERRPAAAPRTIRIAARRALTVTSPPDGGTYLIDPTLRSESRRCRCARWARAGAWSGTWITSRWARRAQTGRFTGRSRAGSTKSSRATRAASWQARQSSSSQLGSGVLCRGHSRCLTNLGGECPRQRTPDPEYSPGA